MERDYEARAKQVAKQIGLGVKAAFKGDRCPRWGDVNGPCKHVHGDRYRVTLELNRLRKSLSFDFWNSQHDQMKSKRPSYYDILSCVALDASMPNEPDELVQQLGEMPPSQANAAARFAKRLQAFFSEAELTALGKIETEEEETR